MNGCRGIGCWADVDMVGAALVGRRSDAEQETVSHRLATGSRGSIPVLIHCKFGVRESLPKEVIDVADLWLHVDLSDAAISVDNF